MFDGRRSKAASPTYRPSPDRPEALPKREQHWCGGSVVLVDDLEFVLDESAPLADRARSPHPAGSPFSEAFLPGAVASMSACPNRRRKGRSPTPAADDHAVPAKPSIMAPCASMSMVRRDCLGSRALTFSRASSGLLRPPSDRWVSSMSVSWNFRWIWRGIPGFVSVSKLHSL